MLKRDEDLYRGRFINFSRYFYETLRHEPYPREYADQGILYSGGDGILFLGLNSSWNIDHFNRTRYGIHGNAVTHGLDKMDRIDHDKQIKIAVFHHPVGVGEAMNPEFLERLTGMGFDICMHGHIHEATQGYYKYDDHHGIHIVGAGTFGAPLKNQHGIPLQYNLLVYDRENHRITVNTRKKENP